MKAEGEMIDFSATITKVPSACHFIETNALAPRKEMGEWLKVLDHESFDYILKLFTKAWDDDGVCDIVSLVALLNEWETGKPLSGADTSWDMAQSLVPRLHRSVIFESMRRRGEVEIHRSSVTDDRIEVEILPTKAGEELLNRMASADCSAREKETDPSEL